MSEIKLNMCFSFTFFLTHVRYIHFAIILVYLDDNKIVQFNLIKATYQGSKINPLRTRKVLSGI